LTAMKGIAEVADSEEEADAFIHPRFTSVIGLECFDGFLGRES